MEDILKFFSENLRLRRRELGMTQRELAEKLGYTEKAVSKWERGASLPPSILLPQLSALLETSIDALMSENAEILYYLGIDGGGTKSDFILADQNGKIRKRTILGSANPNDVGMESCFQVLNAGILDVCDGLPMRNISVFAGLSGGIAGDNQQRIAEHLKHYSFGMVKNGSDAQNAIAVSLGDRDGIVVIMGTGAMAFAQSNGELHRIGGFGYLFGDNGGGFSLGRDAISAALRDECGYGEKTLLTELVLKQCGGASVLGALSNFYDGGKRMVASYAPLVFEALAAGDGVAKKVLSTNMLSVADLIEAAAKHMVGKTPIRVILCGGIPCSRKDVLPLISNALGERAGLYQLEICNRPMVYGALMLAGMGNKKDDIKTKIDSPYDFTNG